MSANIGEPWTAPIKVTAAGYPVLRNGRWHVVDRILGRDDLWRMLKALDGIGDGDFDGTPSRGS